MKFKRSRCCHRRKIDTAKSVRISALLWCLFPIFLLSLIVGLAHSLAQGTGAFAFVTCRYCTVPIYVVFSFFHACCSDEANFRPRPFFSAYFLYAKNETPNTSLNFLSCFDTESFLTNCYSTSCSSMMDSEEAVISDGGAGGRPEVSQSETGSSTSSLPSSYARGAAEGAATAARASNAASDGGKTSPLDDPQPGRFRADTLQGEDLPEFVRQHDSTLSFPEKASRRQRTMRTLVRRIRHYIL